MTVQTKAVPFSDLYPSFLKGFIEPCLKIISDRRELAMKKEKPAATTGKKTPPLSPTGGKKGGKGKAGC